MPLYFFYTMVQKSQKWPKTQIKGGPALTARGQNWVKSVLHDSSWKAQPSKGPTQSPSFSHGGITGDLDFRITMTQTTFLIAKSTAKSLHAQTSKKQQAPAASNMQEGARGKLSGY